MVTGTSASAPGTLVDFDNHASGQPSFIQCVVTECIIDRICVFLATDVRCRALLCQQIIFTLPRNALGIVLTYAYYVLDLCILQLLYKINFLCKYCGHVSGSLSN